MIALLLAAALEIPLISRVSTPLQTASAEVVASSGDELLVAWIDSRDRAIRATRVSAEPRALDPETIRIVPPREPYTSYETPAAAATGRGYVLAFTSRTTAHYTEPDVLVARIAGDGALLDREPRVVATGFAPSIASNGTTTLLTWITPSMQTRGRLFTPAFEAVGDVVLPAGVLAITPRPHGYLLTLLARGKAVVVRVSDDGQLGEETIVGDVTTTWSDVTPAAAAPAPGGALVLYGNGGAVYDALLDNDGRVVARHDVGRCSDDHASIGAVVPRPHGYLATVLCPGVVQRAHFPPPPMYRLYTAELGEQGEVGQVHRPTERLAGRLLTTLGDSVYTMVLDGSANIARLTAEQLSDPLPLSVGEPEPIHVALVRTQDGAIAFWRGLNGFGPESAALRGTRLTPDGADPSMRGRVVSPHGYAVASTGRELLVLDAPDAAAVMTTDGRPLRSFPLRGDAAASDGVHWIVHRDVPAEKTLHIARTALDGSQREETAFDTGAARLAGVECGDGACLAVWITFPGEVWAVLLRADRPLASAQARRIGIGAMDLQGAVGAGAGAFVVATSMQNGSVRASIVSAASGDVEHEAVLATYEPGRTPYLCAGGGADGFEVVLNAWPMEAYRIDRGGTVRPLGTIGAGSARYVVRSGGRGYVVYDRERKLFATITE